jgi:hypothetical protein
MHLQVCGVEEKERNIRARLLTSRGGARCDDGPKASQIHGFLYPFIFATSLCLIHFDRDRPSRLRNAVTLGRSPLGVVVNLDVEIWLRQCKLYRWCRLTPEGHRGDGLG